MQQIWTNPSLQRSFTATGLQGSELEKVLKLTYADKEILVFPNIEYQFTFYDANYGSRRTVTGLVTNVYEDQIKIKVLDQSNDTIDCTSCKNRNNCSNYEMQAKNTKKNTAPMPTCNCVLNPPDVSKYNGPTTYFIPVANIMSINYVKFNPEVPKKPKGGTKVMLLGISATMVKAIIIHLEFFDDSIDNAVKYVDIQKDGIYNIAYEGHNGSMFEIYGKVHSINEVGGPPPRPHGPVHENVGFNNSVFIDGCEDHHDKDDFMKEPPVKKVEIVIDSSSDFSGNYEVIMLDSIRDCTLVQAPEGVDDATGVVGPNGCCDNCDKVEKPREYNYNNDTKVVVTGDKVDIFVKGQKSELDIDTLLKYYLAI